MENLAGVVSRCTSFVCIGHEWARRKYPEAWVSSAESLTHNELIRELTIFNNISELQAATLYEMCLTNCEEAVLVATDVIVNTSAANENYMECFMKHYYNI